jgi:hypothetical protein
MPEKAKSEEQKKGLELLKQANDKRSEDTRRNDDEVRKTSHKRVIKDDDDGPSKFAKQAEETVKASECDCGKTDCDKCKGKIHRIDPPTPMTSEKHTRVKDDDTGSTAGK